MLKLLLHADRTAILERCLRRLEFDKARDAEAKAQADQLEAERMAMQSIDWWALALLPNGTAIWHCICCPAALIQLLGRPTLAIAI